MKGRRAIAAAIALLAAAVPAFAVVLGDSNLTLADYPSMRCTAPYVPIRPDEYSERSYQADRDAYIRCVKKYLTAADNDIQRIQEAQEDAVAKAKRELERR